MRKFVAACCCAIVGLEVLIAVPLITCLVVLGLVGGVGVQQVAGDLPPAIPTYAAAPLPPPLNPTAFSGPTFGPPMSLPAPVALAPSVCTTLPACPMPSEYAGSPSPNACLAPAACPMPPAASAPDLAVPSLPPLSPQVAAIAEVQDQVKGPLADSSLAGNPAELRSDSVAALERVAADSSLPELPALTLPPPTAEPVASLKPEPVAQESAVTVLPPGPCEKAAADCPAPCQALQSIATSLQAAADHLYEKAQSLEADGHFDRADHLRSLARELRREISTLRGEDTSPPVSSVKATSYHAPLAEKPVKTSETIGQSPRLLPARAELAEPMPLPSPMQEPSLLMTVQPGRINIVEEEEDRLGLELAPENPAP